MKRVCILGAVDLSRMTMVSIYTEYFERNQIAYDFIYANKFQEKPSLHAENYYAYPVEEYKDAPFIKKLRHYWKMRSFAKNILEQNHYDLIIVWGEFTSFIFSDILARDFKGKYCLNIRDYFYNNIFFVQNRLKRAVAGACFNTISSDAFVQYLPRADYLMVHSLNKKLLQKLQGRNGLRQPGQPLRILYIGLIARLPHAFRMIDQLQNDARFEMVFAGIGSEDIDHYIQGKGITNVKTYGRFSPDDTYRYLNDADILYNLYGCGDKHFDTALSIKLYYAIFLHIPLMAYAGTHTQEIAEQCGLCFTMEPDNFSRLGDTLYQWYTSLDQDAIREKCDSFIGKVEKSHTDLFETLDHILSGRGE